MSISLAVRRVLRLDQPLGFVLPVLWAALALFGTFSFVSRIPDDMFITFRYAWNLAHGEGFVFNPGERVFGLTNPGHGLVLALLHLVTRISVHLLAAGIFAISAWALVVLSWREARSRGAGLEVALGGTLVLASSYVWLAIGSASATVLALLAGAAILAVRRPTIAGILAGIAVSYRPDAILGVAALGALLWLRKRRFPWRWAFVVAGIVLLGLGAAWLWFGTSLPVTLEAKRVMAEARTNPWTGPVRFWARDAELLLWHFGRGWQLVVGLGLAGQWPLFVRGGTAIRTLVLYGGAVAVAYPLLGVPFFHWYTVPPMVALLLGVGAFAGSAAKGVASALGPGAAEGSEEGGAVPSGASSYPRWAVEALTLATLAAILSLPLLSLVPATWQRFEARNRFQSRYDTFREAGIWIREHSFPEHRIGYGEVGNLAYWSQRPVVDLIGLVSPELLPYVAVNDGLGAFLLAAPDFFIDHAANTHPGIVRQPWFDKAYQPMVTIENPGGGPDPATIYRKRPGAELPPARPPRGPGRPQRGK